MEAPSIPSSGSGGSSSDARAAKKSFASLLSGNLTAGDVTIRKPTTLCNQPAILFTEEEENTLAAEYKFALIGKFSKGLPPFQAIRPALIKLGLKGTFSVGALKPGYIVINPCLEEDFARLWVKQEWSIAGKVMRLFKWTPSFSFSKESAVAPVWVSFPDLPIHLFAKGALYSIASVIGNPIKVDEPTANKSRPSVARVCIEINLLQTPIQQILIRSGQNTFEQKLFYEDPPDYCHLCSHRGHSSEKCFSNGKNLPPTNHTKTIETGNTQQLKQPQQQNPVTSLVTKQNTEKPKEPPCKYTSEPLSLNKTQQTANPTKPTSKTSNRSQNIEQNNGFFQLHRTKNKKKNLRLISKSIHKSKLTPVVNYSPQNFERGESSKSAENLEKEHTSPPLTAGPSNKFSVLEKLQNTDVSIALIAETRLLNPLTMEPDGRFEISEKEDRLVVLPNLPLLTHTAGASSCLRSTVSSETSSMLDALKGGLKDSSPVGPCVSPRTLVGPELFNQPNTSNEPIIIQSALEVDNLFDVVIQPIYSSQIASTEPTSLNPRASECANLFGNSSSPLTGLLEENNNNSLDVLLEPSSTLPIQNNSVSFNSSPTLNQTVFSNEEPNILNINCQQNEQNASLAELDLQEIKESHGIVRRLSLEASSVASESTHNPNDLEELNSKKKARKKGLSQRTVSTRQSTKNTSGSPSSNLL